MAFISRRKSRIRTFSTFLVTAALIGAVLWVEGASLRGWLSTQSATAVTGGRPATASSGRAPASRAATVKQAAQQAAQQPVKGAINESGAGLGAGFQQAPLPTQPKATQPPAQAAPQQPRRQAGAPPAAAAAVAAGTRAAAKAVQSSASAEEVKRRCAGTIGGWCGRYLTQPPLPPSAPRLGSRTCVLDCNRVGVCDGFTGLCRCPAGWQNELHCAEPAPRHCAQRYRSAGFKQLALPGNVSIGITIESHWALVSRGGAARRRCPWPAAARREGRAR